MLQPLVVMSGTAVSANISSYPANVNITLLNDIVGLENDEEYTLSLTVHDSTIIVNPSTTCIVIQDEDSMWHKLNIVFTNSFKQYKLIIFQLFMFTIKCCLN